MSARPHQEVDAGERCYEDGGDPKVLDIIDIPVLDPVPHEYQPENWLLDPDYYWERTGTLAWTSLRHFVDGGDSLWVNGFESSNGWHDRVPVEDAAGCGSSLKLILGCSVEVEVLRNAWDGKVRVKAEFAYGGEGHRLQVTDPLAESHYRQRGLGRYEIGECYLTISLGEALNGYAYKLVAALIPRDGFNDE